MTQTAGLTVCPAHEVAWEDLAGLFGSSAAASRCWCQRFKLARGESFGGFPAEERAHRLRVQTDCGHPDAEGTSGLVGYDGDLAVGWVAVEPRPAYDGLVRHQKVPWLGRAEDPTDASVWAITCLLTRAGHRRRGVSRAMAAAAVEHARAGGARAVEAYPITTTDVISEELLVGTVTTYAAAGLREVSRPTKRRAVMRLDFQGR